LALQRLSANFAICRQANSFLRIFGADLALTFDLKKLPIACMFTILIFSDVQPMYFQSVKD